MAKINIIRNTYGGLEYLLNALAYVSDGRALYRGGLGVNPYDYKKSYIQMLIVRKWFNKLSGNPLVHIVIAYNDQVKDIAVAAMYGQKCAMYFADKYQVLYCTHLKDMAFFCEYVAKVTGQKCWFYFDNKAIYNG